MIYFQNSSSYFVKKITVEVKVCRILGYNVSVGDIQANRVCLWLRIVDRLSTGWSQGSLGLDADGPGLGGVKADGWEVALNGVELRRWIIR